ncbi:MAG: hypothetical protein DRP09_10175 [Candidatus Thorarchaeota archaeon]|nr:MAG: hypothetical protein DRP09_10175 [Candidatus Thorarchaeota archaeon]
MLSQSQKRDAIFLWRKVFNGANMNVVDDNGIERILEDDEYKSIEDFFLKKTDEIHQEFFLSIPDHLEEFMPDHEELYDKLSDFKYLSIIRLSKYIFDLTKSHVYFDVNNLKDYISSIEFCDAEFH